VAQLAYMLQSGQYLTHFHPAVFFYQNITDGSRQFTPYLHLVGGFEISRGRYSDDEISPFHFFSFVPDRIGPIHFLDGQCAGDRSHQKEDQDSLPLKACGPVSHLRPGFLPPKLKDSCYFPF